MNKCKKILMLLLLSFSTLWANIQPGYYEVTALKLNIRNAPDAQSTVLGHVSKDENVHVYKSFDNWAYIGIGWVSGKYLTPLRQTNTAHYSMNASGHTSINQSESMTMEKRIAWSIFIVVLFIYFIFLVLGVSGKIVFYYNGTDLFISLLPWALMLVTLLLMSVYSQDTNIQNIENLTQIQEVIGIIGGLSITLFAIVTIYLSVKYNKSIIMGIPIGIFKLLSALLGVLVLFGQIATMKDKNTNRNQFIFAMLIFGWVVWLSKKLINGKNVYIARGWEV